MVADFPASEYKIRELFISCDVASFHVFKRLLREKEATKANVTLNILILFLIKKAVLCSLGVSFQVSQHILGETRRNQF